MEERWVRWDRWGKFERVNARTSRDERWNVASGGFFRDGGVVYSRRPVYQQTVKGMTIHRIEHVERDQRTSRLERAHSSFAFFVSARADDGLFTFCSFTRLSSRTRLVAPRS